MGFRFFKRVSLAKGMTLNLSKSGGSVSVGPRGARLTLGPSGARVSLGIPGTGLYYTTNFSLGRLGKLFSNTAAGETAEATHAPTTSAEGSPSAAPPERGSDKETKAALAQLEVPDDQKSLADGCKALAEGNEEAAFVHLQHATHLADGAFLAGLLAFKQGQFSDAVQYLTAAAHQEKELGQYLANYGVGATMSLPVTEDVIAHIEPSLRGVLLTLAEAYQAQEKYADAIECLDRLRQLAADDLVVKLSLAELLLESTRGEKDTLHRVIQLADGIENESAIHTALLLFKAQALRRLGLLDAALSVLTSTLRRQKDRSDELLRALRYERAILYEMVGQKKKARTEFEKIYAEDPAYEDVVTRLNL
ncbi:MAG: DUF4236 domain-containing protein [Candidatus Binatia bacterium]